MGGQQPPDQPPIVIIQDALSSRDNYDRRSARTRLADDSDRRLEVLRAHEALIKRAEDKVETPLAELVTDPSFLDRTGNREQNILHRIASRGYYSDAKSERLASLMGWVALRYPGLLNQREASGHTPAFVAVEDWIAVEYLSYLVRLFSAVDDLFGIGASSSLEAVLDAGCPDGDSDACRSSWSSRIMINTNLASTGPGTDMVDSLLVELLRDMVRDEGCPHAAWKLNGRGRNSGTRRLKDLCGFRDCLREGIRGFESNRDAKNSRTSCCLHQLLKLRNLKWEEDETVALLRRVIDIGGHETLGSVDEDGTLPIFKAVYPEPLSWRVVEMLSEANPDAAFNPGPRANRQSAFAYLRDLPRDRAAPGRDEMLHRLKRLYITKHIEKLDSDEVRKALFADVDNFPRMHFDVHAERKLPIDEGYMQFLKENLKVKFDSFLTLVSLPAWSGDPPAQSDPNLSEAAAGAGEPWGPYRKAVFDRLFEGGVRDIQKVEVDDHTEHPHSDAAIIACLKPFKFPAKELDWKKVDLSSRVIREAAPGVTHLTLQCSGREEVLLGWSCKDGLAGLENLEEIHINIDTSVEGSAAEHQYFNDFQRRLCDERSRLGMKPVRKIVPWFSANQSQVSAVSTPTSLFIRPGTNKNIGAYHLTRFLSGSHPWIEHMTRFAGWVRSCTPSAVGKRGKPVKVAIIDDGIQLGHHNFNIASGYSFWKDEVGHEHKDFWIDSGEHGTLMAEYITKLCPMASLYIGRLYNLSTTEGVPSFTADSAMEAIEWAIMQKVDIISMSWSIKKTTINTEDLNRLEKALEKADQNHIILLASLSDDRPHPDNAAYPACCLGRSLLRIGAATKEGDEIAGITRGDADFLFPGADVPYVFRDRHNLVGGSSIATAVAAGFAALLIHCVRLVGFLEPMSSDNSHVSNDTDDGGHGGRIELQKLRDMFTHFGKPGTDRKFPNGVFNELKVPERDPIDAMPGTEAATEDEVKEIMKRVYYSSI
ncbi:hypothetical protein QBC47DRAFT_364659 [Echria macrotheca]|uniref:Peptidase S8/S53 domain-containing protein n=1 Tax=Echria macrotheca TaxID=438768 RepID=A0AAJ0B3P9_9PEZI|nr:hypothetical protein QBC47DRAFT_364659 [Echria macrotheca]